MVRNCKLYVKQNFYFSNVKLYFAIIYKSIFLTDRVKLEAIKQHVDERTLDMEVIVNPKSLEGAHQGVNVIQLETAVGAAMKVYIPPFH